MTNSKGFSITRWLLIAIYLLITLLSVLWNSALASQVMPIIAVFSMFIAAILHGYERYGLKNIAVFFIITWVVSHCFEAISIQTGFPFGFYTYVKLAGPRIAEVPLIIMFAYFATGYASWILSTALLDQYQSKLTGKQIFLVPLIGAFIMVMWDLCMDPISSTDSSLWVWQTPGAYFGVPLKNYFGWFFVVYIVFQLFALYIANYELFEPKKQVIFSSKSFWMEMVALYGIQGLTQVLAPLTATTNIGLYNSMALVTVFTMMFVTLLSYIKIRAASQLT